MKQEDLQTKHVVEHYEAPDIEITDIEISQNILGGSDNPGNAPGDIPINDW